MPPHSHSLEEEGAAIISHKLVQARLGEACSAGPACLAGLDCRRLAQPGARSFLRPSSLAPCPLLRLLRAASWGSVGRWGCSVTFLARLFLGPHREDTLTRPALPTF